MTVATTAASFLALALLAADPAPPASRVLDRVAATVNGEPVTLVELEERAGSEMVRAEAMPPGPGRDRARAKALKLALDNVIAERLLDGQAAALGVEVNDAQVDSTIDEIKRRNGLDDAKLDEVLPQQGFADRAAFRRAIKRDLETASVLQVKVRNRIKITDEDGGRRARLVQPRRAPARRRESGLLAAAGSDLRARRRPPRSPDRADRGAPRRRRPAPRAGEGGDPRSPQQRPARDVPHPVRGRAAQGR